MDNPTTSSHITDEEYTQFVLSDPPYKPWYIIKGVSTSIFSVCRHYGGGRIEGANYTYIRETDELIREDLMLFVARLRAQQKKKERDRLKALQDKNQKRLFQE
jgi:hypothetical protein